MKPQAEKYISILLLILVTFTAALSAQEETPKRIYVHPTGQFRNIGDQAHGPGMLRLLQLHMPEVERYTKFGSRADSWWSKYGLEVQQLYNQNYPNNYAWELMDIMTTSSGPGTLGVDDMDTWVLENPGKPFGFFGITANRDIFYEKNAVIADASFFYTRETLSRDFARFGEPGDERFPGYDGVIPTIEFTPDAVFAFDLTDDERAAAFLASKGLTPGEYLVVVPILRKTPGGIFLEEGPYDDPDNTSNLDTMEGDFAILREVIIRWVRETGKKVLLCPEMAYSLACFDPLIIDLLPEDVKPYVEKRTMADGAHTDPAGFWYADEAGAIYRDAFAMVTMDNHSPIMAVNHATPIVFASPRRGKKEQMWNDIGLGDWFWHGVDDPDFSAADVADVVMAIHDDYPAAKAKVAMAREFVRNRHLQTMGHMRGLIDLPFVADTDADGIADVWETYHYGGPEQCDPAVDSNGNGMAALMEYAFGLTPWKLTQPEHSRYARGETVVEDRDGQKWFVLKWRKNANAPQLEYVVEMSTTLQAESWEPVHPMAEDFTETMLQADLDGDRSTELWETAVRVDAVDAKTIFVKLRVRPLAL